MVKKDGCSYGEPRFSSQHPSDIPQWRVPLVSGDLMPPPGFCGFPHIYGADKLRQVHTPYIHINK